MDVEYRVYDSDEGDGWRFLWPDKRERGWWDLEWLPNKEQWLQGFRLAGQGSWVLQVPQPQPERPFNREDARRIAVKYADEMDE